MIVCPHFCSNSVNNPLHLPPYPSNSAWSLDFISLPGTEKMFVLILCALSFQAPFSKPLRRSHSFVSRKDVRERKSSYHRTNYIRAPSLCGYSCVALVLQLEFAGLASCSRSLYPVSRPQVRHHVYMQDLAALPHPIIPTRRPLSYERLKHHTGAQAGRNIRCLLYYHRMPVPPSGPNPAGNNEIVSKEDRSGSAMLEP